MATTQTQTQEFFARPEMTLGERISQIGAKVSGLVLAVYGAAVIFEVVRSYFLI